MAAVAIIEKHALQHLLHRQIIVDHKDGFEWNS
jgi:hypothetical protein